MRLVLIEWEDSAQPVSAWSLIDAFPWNTVVRCQSVGWLIYDGDDVKALAPNIGDMDNESAQVSGVIRIPARAIVRIDPLFTSADPFWVISKTRDGEIVRR